MPLSVKKVPASHVDMAWPVAQPWLMRGLTAATNVSMTGIIAGLREETDQLWLVLDGTETVGAFLTAVHEDEDDPDTSFLAVYALGGERAPEWAAELGDTVTAFARAQDCEAVRFCGRPAWGRLVPDVQVIAAGNGEHIYERAC
jgi:hypothetical protein